MKRITLILSLFTTLVAQAQTFRIESSFADQVHALVIESQAPVYLFCTAPNGQNSLTLSTSEPEYQFNPVAAVQDSLLTIRYPHAEGSIRLRLSHLPAYITVRQGSTLVIDSLDNFTAHSGWAEFEFLVEPMAELRIKPHFAPYNLLLEGDSLSHIVFEQGITPRFGTFNILNDCTVDYGGDKTKLGAFVFIFNDPTHETITRHHNKDIAKRRYPADNQLQLRWNAGVATAYNSRAASLSPYALSMGIMGEISLLWYANWDRRYYDRFDESGRSPYKRHRTWVGLTYGIELLPFANQVVLADGGDISFTDNPSAVPTVPNYGPGCKPLFCNTYLSLPLQYAYMNDHRSGFNIGLRPGLNLNAFYGAWRTNGFGIQGGAHMEGNDISVVNPCRLDLDFSFALRGWRFLPNVRVGLLPTFTTSEGRGVRTMSLSWHL